MVKGDRLLPLPELEKKVGFKHSKIYALIRAGEFPPGKLIFGKRLWRESEIDAWVERVWKDASQDQVVTGQPKTSRGVDATAPSPAPPTTQDSAAVRPPPLTSTYWSSADLCERYGVSRRTLTRWAQTKAFPGPTLSGGHGAQARWHVEDVLVWEDQARGRRSR